MKRYSNNGAELSYNGCIADDINIINEDKAGNNIDKIEITVEGFKIGTAENLDGLTGVSVIIAEEGAKAGVDVRGCAPGTRETDLLKSEKTVDTVHAVVLSGGSAYGLEASSGVMNYLENKGIGFEVGSVRVPIVCSAVIFDLLAGDSSIRPGLDMGIKAAESASDVIKVGNVGAGTGATVGKFAGPFNIMKGGAGYSEITLGNGLKVGAYVIVNSFGEVFDGDNILAGVAERNSDNGHDRRLISYETLLMKKYGTESEKGQSGNISLNQLNSENMKGQNTTIGCIITNAEISKVDCNNVSKTAHNGLALSIRPVHTSMDGDTIFTMASGKIETDLDEVCYLAQKAMREAVINAVKSAESVDGIISYRDIAR